MVTLEDVAVLAGVSRATVSRVVNGDTNVKPLTREKVEQAVETDRRTAIGGPVEAVTHDVIPSL